jgi:all-trans-8'-apo-beta-carotenal 15,15'-oxygenase
MASSRCAWRALCPRNCAACSIAADPPASASAASHLHWFDADGAVAAIRFEGQQVDAAVRTVATRWLRDEQAANRQLYRSYAQLGRGWRRWLTLPKNPANISVMPFDGQVLRWEAGLPIALDPATLEARGETTGRAHRPDVLRASASRRQTLFNFGVRYGAKFSIDLYSFERDIKRIANVPLARPTIIHDFIATPKHVIFFVAPVRLRLARLLAGLGSFDSNLAWEPQHGTEVIVIPLANPEHPTRFTVPPFFQWHFVNAFEERTSEGDSLIVDYLPYDDFETNAWFGRAPYEPAQQPPPSRYARARLHLASRTMDVDVLSDVSTDFRRFIRTTRTRARARVAARSAARHSAVLARFDTKSRTLRHVPLGDNTFPSRRRTRGWVLSPCHGNRDASYVAVIDSAPEDGAARALVRSRTPSCFMGRGPNETVSVFPALSVDPLRRFPDVWFRTAYGRRCALKYRSGVRPQKRT